MHDICICMLGITNHDALNCNTTPWCISWLSGLTVGLTMCKLWSGHDLNMYEYKITVKYFWFATSPKCIYWPYFILLGLNVWKIWPGHGKAKTIIQSVKRRTCTKAIESADDSYLTWISLHLFNISPQYFYQDISSSISESSIRIENMQFQQSTTVYAIMLVFQSIWTPLIFAFIDILHTTVFGHHIILNTNNNRNF